MPELHPALVAELAVLGRQVRRKRLAVGIAMIVVGAGAILAGFIHAVNVGGIDGISTILGTSLVAGFLLPRGALVVDQITAVPPRSRTTEA